MEIRIYGLVNDSIVDGPGLRFSVFTQGCHHHCPGCHNPESHDPEGGTVYTVDDVIAQMTANPLLDGITLTGGDPFEQPEACRMLAEAAHAHHLTVWAYSGYTYEQLLSGAAGEAGIDLLRTVDVLVDGPFILSQRSLELKFCGSRNQRLIDVPASQAKGEVVLWRDPWAISL